MYASFNHALLSKSHRNRLKMAGDASTKGGQRLKIESNRAKKRIRLCGYRQHKMLRRTIRLIPVFFHPYVCRAMFP